nr:hypothetical protein [uncultured Caldimonas sp.]
MRRELSASDEGAMAAREHSAHRSIGICHQLGENAPTACGFHHSIVSNNTHDTYKNMIHKSLCTLLYCLALPLAASAVEVVPPHSKTPHMAAEWWQWALSFPRGSGPVADVTGERCALGQRGDVWFLAGAFGSSKVRRTCSIPAGKTLFFPLINMAYWPSRDATNFTCNRAKELAALNNETALDLFAEVDGVSLPNLERLRVASVRCFDAFARVPADEKPYKAYPAATDGYWLQLKPLPRGQHTLKFGGRYNRESGPYARMVQDIEYVLVVD